MYLLYFIWNIAFLQKKSILNFNFFHLYFYFPTEGDCLFPIVADGSIYLQNVQCIFQVFSFFICFDISAFLFNNKITIGSHPNV